MPLRLPTHNTKHETLYCLWGALRLPPGFVTSITCGDIVLKKDGLQTNTNHFSHKKQDNLSPGGRCGMS